MALLFQPQLAQVPAGVKTDRAVTLPAPSMSCQAAGGRPLMGPSLYQVAGWGEGLGGGPLQTKEQVLPPGCSLARSPPEPASPTHAPASPVTESPPLQLAGHVSRAHTGPRPPGWGEVGMGRRGHGMAGRFLLALMGLTLSGLQFLV